MTTPLNVGVIGCGRMGRLHARVYSQMPQVKLVGVHDANAESAVAAAKEYHTDAVSMDDLLERAAAVTIAVPTQHHLAVAQRFIERRIPCLIEKPLALNSTEARRIVNLASERDTLVQVGHIERFNPAVRAMRRLNITPRFMEVTRISPLTFRSIDVGVVLDMMIHDIDIVLMLARSPVAAVDAVGVSVIGGGTDAAAEDICNARIRFQSGCVANITASRLALKTERRLRLFSNDAYVSLDYQKRYGIVAQRGGNVDALRNAVARIRSGEIEDLSELNYQDLVNVEELQIDDVEPLRSQLDAFVESVTTRTPPAVSAQDGLAAVELAEQIVAAMGQTAL